MTKRDTVGKISSELSQKTPESRNPVELQRGMQKEYLDELIDCVKTHDKIFDTDFFIVVITKNEKLMPNVFRNYFVARLSCPTPDYDQTVFRYHKKDQNLEYIWTVPCKDACIYLKNNALQVEQEEKSALNFVLQFSDGTLFKKAQTFNGEIALH